MDNTQAKNPTFLFQARLHLFTVAIFIAVVAGCATPGRIASEAAQAGFDEKPMLSCGQDELGGAYLVAAATE